MLTIDEQPLPLTLNLSTLRRYCRPFRQGTRAPRRGGGQVRYLNGYVQGLKANWSHD